MRYHKSGDKIKIRIVCIGRAKEEWKDIFKEFEKRISALAKLEFLSFVKVRKGKNFRLCKGLFCCT